MPPLHRHQLAYLTAAGWRANRERARDADARACLNHWEAQDLPVVVTRQPAPSADTSGLVTLGLPAPACWGRRALPLWASMDQIRWFSEFPTLRTVAEGARRADRPALQALDHALWALGITARVYGSHGWQCLSGLEHVHADSDIDLWMHVGSVRQADSAVAVLSACRARARIDGELLLPDGGSVAWREWAAGRQRPDRPVLVKRLHGVALEHLVGFERACTGAAA